MNKVKQERRSFLKSTLAGTVAAATLVIRAKQTVAKERHGNSGPQTGGKHKEILYKETEEFRKHYQSLYS